MNKFDKLSTFITVVEENGFAAAAKIKGVTTGTISKQIALLESELGVQLLHRTTRQLSLTEIGKTYYEYCKNPMLELEQADRVIAESKQEATGTLNIVASRYFAITHIIPKLSAFMRLNPRLQINLQLDERFPNLEKEEIDVLFGISIEGTDDLVRRRVAKTRYILCASPQYLKKYGIPLLPTDLQKHHFITHIMRKPNNVIHFNNDEQIKVEPILFLNDTFAMRECALLGNGVVNLHDFLVADALKEGKLVELLSDYQLPEMNVYLYYKQSRYKLFKIRKFIDFFVGI
jgi:DNA-binding transcriptional LysR family regulator